MSKASFMRRWRVGYRRGCASAVFLDEDGLRGQIYFCHTWRLIVVTDRFTGCVLLREEVWPWHPAFADIIRDWGSYVMGVVKRIKKDETGVSGERAVDADFAVGFPGLHEHLTLDWLEGAKRQTSSLGISVDGGRWKGRLADRENGLVLFVTGDGFDAVLGALERAVHDPAADWREDHFAGGKGRKRG